MAKSPWTVQRRRLLLGYSQDASSGDWSTAPMPSGTKGARGSGSAVGLLLLAVADLFTSFLWTWGMHHAYAASGNQPSTNAAVYIAGKFLFSWLTNFIGGSSTNPLTALTSTSVAAGGRYGVLATVLVRLPSQVAGATVGILVFTKSYPGYEPGPFLQADIYLGAAVQGILAFTMAVVNLTTAGVAFFQQTFLVVMTRVTLNQLGAGLTNGWLNPASAFGWAYVYGIHTTKEHIFVYWIVPVLATLFGVQLHDSFIQQESSGTRWKSD